MSNFFTTIFATKTNSTAYSLKIAVFLILMEKTPNAIVVFCINQFKLNNGTFVI